VERWVLVTDGGTGQGRSALAAVRGLAAAGYRAAVTTSGDHSLAGASRFCDRRVSVPSVDDPRYPDAVRAELAARRYLTVLAASDRALLALELVDDTLVDKASMAKAAAAAGLPTPEGKTYATLTELRDDASALPYPAVIKPSISRFTAKRVDRPSDVERLDGVDGPFLVQPFIDAPLRSIGGVMWEGRLVAAVHQRYLRTWPASCGGASAAETVGPDLDLEERTRELLGEHAGIFHLQFAGDLLLDVNPRVYGSHPLAQRAGVNLVGLTCDLLRGSPPPRAVLRAAPGVFYRSLEGDVRNRVHELRRGRIGVVEAVSSLIPRRGVAHGPESLADPGPMIARGRFAARRLIQRTP
jgi:predicted ATP-grasp superfamily ATP-dependent carboligase